MILDLPAFDSILDLRLLQEPPIYIPQGKPSSHLPIPMCPTPSKFSRSLLSLLLLTTLLPPTQSANVSSAIPAPSGDNKPSGATFLEVTFTTVEPSHVGLPFLTVKFYSMIPSLLMQYSPN